MYKVYILNHDGDDIPYEDWSYIHTVFIGEPSKEELLDVIGEDFDLDKLIGGGWFRGDAGIWHLEIVDAIMTNSFKETL